ncbi:MAG: class I SAM-dependent methyltransferase, partial [Gemmatimonadaceae bacterium]
MDLVERGDAGAYRHPWETARFKFVSKLIAEYGDRESSVVVDIGSGDGFFLESLRKTLRDGQFVGLDIALTDDEVRELNAGASDGVRFCNSPEQLEQLLSRPADVILLLDVIEHIADDHTFLRDLAKRPFMSYETVTIVTVPAFWSLHTSHDEYLKHFRRYSLSQARRALSDTGFKTIAEGYFFFSLLIPRVVSKLRESIFSPKRQYGIGRWRSGRAVTKTIEAALLTDAAIGRALARALPARVALPARRRAARRPAHGLR